MSDDEFIKIVEVVTIPRAQYDALMAAAKALQDFWGFTQARGGEYHVVARQTMDALDALRAAGVEMPPREVDILYNLGAKTEEEAIINRAAGRGDGGD